MRVGLGQRGPWSARCSTSGPCGSAGEAQATWSVVGVPHVHAARSVRPRRDTPGCAPLLPVAHQRLSNAMSPCMGVGGNSLSVGAPRRLAASGYMWLEALARPLGLDQPLDCPVPVP